MNVAGALAPWFAHHLGVGSVEIGDVKRHAEGWSWQTYTMTVDGRGYAVRREPEDGLLAPYDIAAQYRLHEALCARGEGIPMPALVALELDRGVLGMPFYVMERVEGTVPVQWDAAFATDDARVAIGHQFVDLAAAIHRFDWRAGPLTPRAASADGVAAALIDDLEARYETDVRVETPVLREGLLWCRRNIATSGELALTHGDFRIGNFMVDGGRIVAVFDWELAEISDPVADLAWAGLRLFRGRSPRWSQLLEPDEFLARYRTASGRQVDADVLRFWTVFAHVKAAVPHLRAARVYEDGTFDDLRLACMGHQVLYILRSLAEELGI